MRASEGDLLPLNTDGLPNAGGPDPGLFLAGDVRANEQVGLTAMHTLFVREHNRLADLIAVQRPSSTDEEIYQTARKLVGAEMQVITYDKFLPTLLGDSVPKATDYVYDPDLDPSISNEFSTALYRFGHSMLSPQLMLMEDSETVSGSIALRDAFFNPDFLKTDPHRVDLLLMGLASQPAQEIDLKMVDDVRNFLFGPPGAGGLDLAALNIQRGRDHGLPDYNTLRQAYGLPAVTDFVQISSDVAVQSTLESLYGRVDNIDAWVGGLAEDHLAGASVGELVSAALVDQFTRLRDGDRLFYLNDPDLAHPDIQAIIDLDQITLADIIMLNSDVSSMQADVFLIPEPSTITLAAFGLIGLIGCATSRRRLTVASESV